MEEKSQRISTYVLCLYMIIEHTFKLVKDQIVSAYSAEYWEKLEPVSRPCPLWLITWQVMKLCRAQITAILDISGYLSSFLLFSVSILVVSRSSALVC